ncbi:MAG: hypothetical protein IPJ65_34540 [Archangiaceae bacterium]|nr:hypothetical protein [Archangiaceae bacterium]
MVIPTLGVVRVDAMHVSTIEGWRHLLAVADASIPYRTMLAMVGSYDSSSAATLNLGILLNGAPLVYRFDRAKCHRTAEVREVLNRHEVLVLQGPPRHPRYGGQLERQNREHRAWLN